MVFYSRLSMETEAQAFGVGEKMEAKSATKKEVHVEKADFLDWLLAIDTSLQ